MANFLPCLVILVQLASSSSALNVDLQILSKLFLPYTYRPTGEYLPDKDAAEQMAYDVETKLLYSVGNTNIHVIDVSDVTDLTVLYHSSLENVDITDVEVCGEFVFVAVDNKTKPEHGFVDIYRTYNEQTKAMEHAQRIIVGDLPDMILVTRDCSKLVVALEAEPHDDDNTKTLVDGPGAVVIISFAGTPSGSYSTTTLDFTQFDSRIDELEKSGVRQVYKGNNNLFSNDVEPEYIAFNEEETKAFVSLQENNAIAVIDMETEQIENVFGLGFKDWSDKLIDVSDKDGAINLRPWSVLGMYQPDSVQVYRHRGVDYVITANEGDSKDYEYFSEEVRVAAVGLSELFESNATVRDILEHENTLGRLKVTTVNGFNATSQKFDRLYTYGGRGFSIRRADTMELVYDSDSEFSQKISLLHPNLFNSNLDGNKLASATLDSRSDDKGPETESLAIGKFGDITLVFAGNERPGWIAVYSIDGRNPDVRPRFETLLEDIPRTNETWSKLYEDRAISMIDCEDMRFIAASDSPNGQPLLLVSGSGSGTITVVQVNVKDYDTTYDSASIVTNVLGLIAISLVASLSEIFT